MAPDGEEVGEFGFSHDGQGHVFISIILYW